MGIYLAYLRLRSVRTAALVYFIIACLFAIVPLFDYLGFEFAAALSVPASLISGYLTLSFLDDHRTKPLTRRTWLYVVGDYLLVNGALLVIPFIVLSLNALFVKNCSFVDGCLYFILLPLCTVVFSVALALCCGTIFRKPRTVFTLCVAAILAQIPWTTYFGPQVAAYNFILGYFPGITYDESVVDVSRLALYREFTLVLALSLLMLFFFLVGKVDRKAPLHRRLRGMGIDRRDRGLLFSGALCFAILLAGHLGRSSLGFQETEDDIRQGLGGTILSTHFILYVPASQLTAEQIRLMRDEAEYDYAVVSRRLDETLPAGAKVRVFVYPDGATKQFFIGTSSTNIAKPWLREIHLTLDSFEPTLRHELVHVLAGRFGAPVIKASILMGLNEGLAMAVAWNNEDASPHEYAAALQHEGLLGDPSVLFDLTGFALQAGAYAYEVSGSFAKYLIDRFGIGAFKELYAGAPFLVVYGESRAALLQDWKVFLRSVDVSALTSEAMKTKFLQPAIFHKTCPRVTAERNRSAMRAIRAGRYDTAERQFAAAFDEAPTAGSLCGYYQALLLEGKSSSVVRSYEEMDKRSMLAYHPAVLLMNGDALWFTGNIEGALRRYRAIAGMNFSEAYSEAAALRGRLLMELDSPDHLLRYWYGLEPDSMRMNEAEALNGAVHGPASSYLVALEQFRLGKFRDAALRWQKLLPKLDDQVLAFAAAKRAGEAFYRSGEFERAAAMFWQAMNYTTSETRQLYLKDRIAQCSFIEALRSDQ